MPSTIRLHRVFKTKPERLYKAFITPEAMVKWLPPHGFIGKVHSINARVGGSYKMSFTNLGTAYAFTNNGLIGAPGTFFASDRIRQDVDLVTVRVNYRWGGPVVAKY